MISGSYICAACADKTQNKEPVDDTDPVIKSLQNSMGQLGTRILDLERKLNQLETLQQKEKSQ